ncbi:MAG: hypothetical protein FWE27_08910 [Defluviitaleaceae bacterium]|nr:hypothetical protein [Defluviitaleaceae bacterium]
MQFTMVQDKTYSSAYSEVKFGKTLYQITSVFTGEKELGLTLEKLAAQHILDEMDGRAKELLRT